MQSPITSTSSLKPKRVTPPWVRRRRVLLLIAVIVFILPGILLVVVRALSERKFSGYVEAIRAEGLPVSPAELERWRETVTSEDKISPLFPADEAEGTAVDLYIEAAGMLRRLHNQLTLNRMEEIMGQVEEEGCLEDVDIEELGANLAANKEPLALLYRAASRSPGRTVLDYTQGLHLELPHLAGFRTNVRVLRIDAIHAAFQQDPVRVYEALVAAMAAVRILGAEPVLMVQLVRCACVGIIFDTVREVLAQVTFDEPQFAWLQRWFSDVHIPGMFYNALIGERVFGIMAYKNPVMLATADENWAKEEYAVPIISAASALGFYNREWDRYFSTMEELIAGIRLPYHEAQAVCDRLLDRRLIRNPPERSRRHHPRPSLPELSKTLYGFTRIPQAKARDQARSTLGATAMAIERYRLASGQFPETLQALVPEYLPAVPEDPIDLQPVRYRCDEEACVVYSIGTNGVDDGGLASDVINEGDITFFLSWRRN